MSEVSKVSKGTALNRVGVSRVASTIPFSCRLFNARYVCTLSILSTVDTELAPCGPLLDKKM